MDGVGRECTPAPERFAAGISGVRNGGGKGCGKGPFARGQSAPGMVPVSVLHCFLCNLVKC